MIYMLSVDSDDIYASVECVRLLINWYVFLIQKLAKSLSVSCGIEPDEEGSTGLRLTARGSVTTYTYRMDTDGRTHLNSARWKKFLDGKNLRVGHPNYYQEHPPHRLEDDDHRRYHLQLHMCVWLYHLELHMMIAIDMTLYYLRMHVDYAWNCYLVLPSYQITRRGLN